MLNPSENVQAPPPARRRAAEIHRNWLVITPPSNRLVRTPERTRITRCLVRKVKS